MKLELHATPWEVMRAVATMREFAQARGVPEKTLFELALALEECGSNIVNHALKRDASKSFQVSFEHTPDTFIIELRDRGPEFDPTTSVNCKSHAEDADLPGGWGIKLVRRYMNGIGYRREAGENILRLTRRIPPTAGG